MQSKESGEQEKKRSEKVKRESEEIETSKRGKDLKLPLKGQFEMKTANFMVFASTKVLLPENAKSVELTK